MNKSTFPEYVPSHENAAKQWVYSQSKYQYACPARVREKGRTRSAESLCVVIDRSRWVAAMLKVSKKKGRSPYAVVSS